MGLDPKMHPQCILGAFTPVNRAVHISPEMDVTTRFAVAPDKHQSKDDHDIYWEGVRFVDQESDGLQKHFIYLSTSSSACRKHPVLDLVLTLLSFPDLNPI